MESFGNQNSLIQDYGKQIDDYLHRLFPITRSITGEGNRETLRIIQEIIPLEIKEYPSGQHVYDWVIPKEWNIKDAWIKNSKGEKIVDFKKNNLHLVSYSVPVHKKLMFSELQKHLHYREDLPEAIPYRTTYYEETWGFCVSYHDLNVSFNEKEEYEVYIDSSLTNGSLSLGELLIHGKSSKEYLISTYICHPSMANDNLSGVVMTAFLAKELLKKKLNFSYRIIFVPETIGAIAYCANNEKAMEKIDCGFVVTTVGGPGQFGYKQSFVKDHFINRTIEQTFNDNNTDYITYPFDIHGSDERQYSSPGFRINMASICKDRYYEYDYYHTSLDDLNFVKAEFVAKSLKLYLKTINKLEKNLIYKNMKEHCEVMLSGHKLYPKKGGKMLPGKNSGEELDMILWLLFYCDGTIPLQLISDKLSVDFSILYKIALLLEQKGLLQRI